MATPRTNTRRKHFLPEWLYRLLLIVLGLVLFGFVIFSKASGVEAFAAQPILLAYTILVTCFELSRVLSAILYDNDSHLVAVDDDKSDLITGHYEPTVSFVIPCKNEELSIEKTVLKSLNADYPKEKIEVIVINDGSTDGTLGVLQRVQKEHPELMIVDWKENRGKRHGMAEGFRLAQGEIVVQLDSDSYIEPSTFRHLIEPFRNKRIGAVCAHADPENADQNFLTRMQAAYYFMSFRILKAAESTFYTVFCCSGCSSAYRKSIVAPIMDTWLNEKFLGLPVTWGDDRALTNWVIKLGYRTMYSDRAQAYTICPDNIKQLMKQQVRWKKGWFVNSIFASKFLWKDHPFVAFTYFFPLIFLTLVTPFMAARAFLYNPIVHHQAPTFYVLGVLLVAAIVTVYYRWVARENKYWPYVFAWAGLNMVVLSFVLFYAMFSIQNRKWGTR